MDFIRGKIGVAQNNAPAPPKKEEPPAPDAERLLNTNRVRLRQKEAELLSVSKQLDAAIRDSRQVKLQSQLLQQKRALENDITILRNKIANQVVAADALATANANLEQARILQSGAKQLEEVVVQTDELEVEELIKSYQTSALASNKIGTLLSEPLNLAETDPFQESVDDELARLREEIALEQMSTATGAGATDATGASQTSTKIRDGARH